MMGRTRLWAVTVAAGAAVAVGAIGTAAMGDGRDDSGDKQSHEQRESHGSGDWNDSRGSGDSWDWRGSHGKDERKETARATLSGYQEDPKTISTPGSGRFEARIDERNKEISWRLSYEDLKDVQQAHIHFGGKHQSGGVAVFLCSNIKDGKGGPSKNVQSCPEAPATIKGTIKPDDVVGPADQGIEPGEFDELVDAMEAGVTYVNVHTKKYPEGEIRGQIKVDEDRKGKDEDRKDEDRKWDASDSRAWDSSDEAHGWDKGDEGRSEDSGWDADKGWDSDKGEDRGDEKGEDKGEHRDSDSGEDKGSDKGDDHRDGWASDEK
ncbi:CHRD domain-containing protein [Micromonospora globbae]|uniref:CHRD domain-containing protein n=1 Tax=Micromonospora globbae TaxID=1894969 RepID=UPI00342A49BB